MLRTRVVTGIVLAAASLALVWLSPPVLVAVLFAAVTLIACFEWGGLAGLSQPARFAYAAGVVMLLAAAAWLMGTGVSLLAITGLAAAVWGVAIAQVVVYLRGRQAPWPRPVSLAAGGMLLSASWLSLVAPFLQRADGAYWLTALFIIVWGSDIGGYAVGRSMGRRALASAISPGKTWEGCLGGMLLAATGLALLIGLLSSLGAFVQGVPWHHLWVVPVVVAAAIAGDLFESVLKRQAGVKDSGRIVAGHGGVLDRVDAMLMAAPVFAFLTAALP